MEAPAPWEPQAGGSASLPTPHPPFRPGSAWGQAHPGWGQPSLQTQWRPLPTDHTAAFPEASLGRGLRIWKLERNLLVSHPSPLTVSASGVSRRESLGKVAFWVTQRSGHRHSGLGEAQPQNCGKGSHRQEAWKGECVQGRSRPQKPSMEWAECDLSQQPEASVASSTGRGGRHPPRNGLSLPVDQEAPAGRDPAYSSLDSLVWTVASKPSAVTYSKKCILGHNSIHAHCV